jgi:membrane peptidoglycan carboxypeptidase
VDLGFTTQLQPYFAIGLGAEPATPLELARAYTAFANGGARIDGSITGNAPRAVESIEDPNGNRRFNEAVPKRVLADWKAAIVNDLLEGVVAYGTGKAARLSGFAVAGKTGTTENYGDAWFVGYTPELVTAVWIGYPDELRPMLTEYHGRPVAGGTYPALVWKAYMEKALEHLGTPPTSFAEASLPYASTETVVLRDARLHRDNGYCSDTVSVQLFSGSELPVADCKPNEVEVPDVRGSTLAAARARLEGQPLVASVAAVPADPGQRVGIVIRQIPAGGRLSAHDQVTLVVRRATQGVVPKLVGLTADEAVARLAPLAAEVELQGSETGRVAAQWPRAGVAAAPGMRVVVTVRPAGTDG